MASQETPNYRLSRWAGTDRILVEEFNDNWDKIDTALKGNADAVAAAQATATALEQKMDLQLIGTRTAPAQSNQVQINLDIDWIKWSEVQILINPKFTAAAGYYPALVIRSGEIVRLTSSYINGRFGFTYRKLPDAALPMVIQLWNGESYIYDTPPVWTKLQLQVYSSSSQVTTATIVKIFARV